jgi:hypothetical protein
MSQDEQDYPSNEHPVNPVILSKGRQDFKIFQDKQDSRLTSILNKHPVNSVKSCNPV